MSSLPELGRTQQLATLQESAERAVRGEHVAVGVHGTPGSGKSRLLDEFEGRLHSSEELEIRRARAFPASATRPGGISDDLGLDDLAADRTAILMVDDAQWSDPTSLTRLRTLLLEPGGAGRLVVLTHRPLDAGTAPGLDRLIEATGRRDRLVRLVLGPISVADLAEVIEGPDRTAIAERLIASSGGVVSELETLVDQLVEDGSLRREGDRLLAVRPVSDWPEVRSLHQRIGELPSDERLLVHAAVVAGHPIPLSVAAELLGRDPDDALEVAEHLVDDGFLTEHTNGFQPRTGPEAESLAAELGEVRKTRIFERLADAMTAAGLQDREPGLVGLQFLRAQRWEDALSQLSEAGLAAAKGNALAEALPLVSGALEALEHVGTRDPELAGRLYFARARCHRMLGSSDLADDDAAEATRLLTGDERMRALGWQAQIADDDQRATVGEWLAAAAELEAARLGDLASQGVNLTLRAKMLGRLGLPVEADACLTRGIRLLRHHGDPYLHFFGHYNGGWVSFDRGLVRQAEAGFEYSVSQARSFDGEQFHADTQAWWARTLFWSGRITEALEVFDSARDTADRADSQGAIYLTALGRAEGMVLLGRYDDALAYGEETLGHVRRLGMAWENVARYVIASAHLGAGRLDDALEEAELAVASCPQGNDGQRWRLACQALVLEIRGGLGEPWPEVEAATLTRELLAGRWLAPATRLLAARARHEDNRELGRWAAAIALEMGVPMLAARAVSSAQLWDDVVAPTVRDAVREMADHIPEEWRADWDLLPEVAPALEADEATIAERQEAGEQLRTDLRNALAWVALDPADLRLGPDEWAAPLARPEIITPKRRRTILVASIAALLLLGGGIVGSQFGAAPPPIVDASGPAEPQAPAPEPELTERIITAESQVAGSWTFGGGPERSGVSDRSGVPSVDGVWWEPFCTGQPIRSSAAVRGNMLLFGSDDGNVYALDTRTGRQLWRRPTNGPVRSSPAIVTGVGEGGLAERDDLVVVGSDDGNVYAWVPRTGEPRWSFPTGAEVRSSPAIVDGVVYVASRDGRLYALDAADGNNVLWTFPPADEEALGPIDSSPAVHGDRVFVGTDEGILYALSRADGTVDWESRPLGAGIVAAPVVSEGVVYVGSLDQNVWAFQAETGQLAGIGTYPTDTPVRSTPAIADGLIYVPSSNRLIAIDEMNTVVNSFSIGSQTESSPTVAGNVVYVASDDGHVYAFDRDGGEDPLWAFPTARRGITSSPAIADHAIFIGGSDGCMYAIGGYPED